MEFTWLLPAVIIYMVVRSIAKGAKSAAEDARREAGRRAAAGAAAGTSVGASDLMRELQNVLEESRRMAEGGTLSPPRPARPPVPRRNPVKALPTPRPVRVVVKGEEPRSLEVITEESTSLDVEAETIIARRRAEVERRNTALAGDDHAAFDKRIRAAQPVQRVVPTPARRPPGGLRAAMIWNEVLGKPVGLK
ncbi:MAG TPA: hypothetical protein VFS94_03025 [Gemmatimonadales bacterium]|nr:hypothetical protein [Gemmatimonadales bacterium]